MKKMSFRVSGSRVGDSARPATDRVIELAPKKPLGFRPAPILKAAVARAFGPEDYATAEDYE